MIKIIALVIMLLAFVANFAVPKFLKSKREDISVEEMLKIKTIFLFIVIICAIAVFLF